MLLFFRFEVGKANPSHRTMIRSMRGPLKCQKGKEQHMIGKISAVITATTILFLGSNAVQGAKLTFDDLITGQTSYGFDGDADSIDDVIFSTVDPAGFNTIGPGPNMTYINEPGLEGTALLATDLRVDFTFGAAASLKFGFALDSFGDDKTAGYPYAEFKVYDTGDTLIASQKVDGYYTAIDGGFSTYPEGEISVTFSGLAAYATFDFQSDYGRFIIDNFEGTFGSTEDPPIHTTPDGGSCLMLYGLAFLGLGTVRRLLRQE